MDRNLAASIQLRRDIASNWQTQNPTLRSGEVGFESDTRKIKIGDGTTPWEDLDPFGIDVGYARYDITLSATSWASGSYTIENDRITLASAGTLAIAQTATAEQYDAWALCMPQVTAQALGSITITARGEVPTIDIPVTLEIRGSTGDEDNPPPVISFNGRTGNVVPQAGDYTADDVGAAPAIHADRHATGGADPITPASIGAAAETHAEQHASTGSDPITLESIGAASAEELTQTSLGLQREMGIIDDKIDGRVYRSGDEMTGPLQLKSYGEAIVAMTGSAIQARNGCVFTKTIDAATTFTFDLTVALPDGYAHSIVLLLTMGATPYSVSFPSSVAWMGPEPEYEASKVYEIVLRTYDQGSTWIASCGGGV